jgi:hypothetical protein
MMIPCPMLLHRATVASGTFFYATGVSSAIFAGQAIRIKYLVADKIAVGSLARHLRKNHAIPAICKSSHYKQGIYDYRYENPQNPPL